LREKLYWPRRNNAAAFPRFEIGRFLAYNEVDADKRRQTVDVLRVKERRRDRMQHLQQWLHDHPVVSYFIIFALSVYVFNSVFRAERLPLAKEIFLYLFMAAGSWLLWILQHDRLPIVPILAGTAVLVLLVQIRRRLARKGSSGAPNERADGREGAEGGKTADGGTSPEAGAAGNPEEKSFTEGESAADGAAGAENR